MPNYFLNLFRPKPAKPSNPEPSNKSVAGSGAGLGSFAVSVPPVLTGAETVLDVFTGFVGSLEGQPTSPKNRITTHKTINNFLIFFLRFPKILLSPLPIIQKNELILKIP
jgi:hypothetical protein